MGPQLCFFGLGKLEDGSWSIFGLGSGDSHHFKGFHLGEMLTMCRMLFGSPGSPRNVIPRHPLKLVDLYIQQTEKEDAILYITH